MSDIPFHMTRQGARFFEHTFPELVRQIERLNQSLERLADLHVQAGTQQRHQEPEEKDSGQELHEKES